MLYISKFQMKERGGKVVDWVDKFQSKEVSQRRWQVVQRVSIPINICEILLFLTTSFTPPSSPPPFVKYLDRLNWRNLRVCGRLSNGWSNMNPTVREVRRGGRE